MTGVQTCALPIYQGAIAAQITDYLASVGGVLTMDDLAAHRSDWVEPLETTYRGYRVMQMPPNSQGFTVLSMLNLIELFDLTQLGADSADYYRSEEHTSELQSQSTISYAVFCLKKKKQKTHVDSYCSITS